MTGFGIPAGLIGPSTAPGAPFVLAAFGGATPIAGAGNGVGLQKANRNKGIMISS